MQKVLAGAVLAVMMLLPGHALAQSSVAESSPPAEIASPAGEGEEQAPAKVAPGVRLIRVPEHLLKQRRVYKGERPEPKIALTFDDGPHPEFIPRTLDLLARYGAKATFFLVGKKIDKYPELARSIVEAGHEVANHTYNHPNLAKLTPKEALVELEAMNDALERAAGVRTYLFRPPGGNYTPELLDELAGHGYLTVLWSANTADYSRPGVTEISRVLLGGIRPGAIYLIHLGVEQTLEALPYVLEALTHKGYSFVTVGELLGLLPETLPATARQ